MAKTAEIITSKIKSLDNIFHKLKIDAPSTFRMPISFVRCSATKEAKPNNPRQLINMASAAKIADNVPTRSSDANLAACSRSANLKSKGTSGKYLLKTCSICAVDSVKLLAG